jgi:hypothetical protein
MKKRMSGKRKRIDEENMDDQWIGINWNGFVHLSMNLEEFHSGPQVGSVTPRAEQ